MTESEFNTLADAVFKRIEHALDGSDLDYDSNGMVLEIEFEDGGKLIVNRHLPNREIWLAARSGGFHFGWRDGAWISQREGEELFAKMALLVRNGCGEEIAF